MTHVDVTVPDGLLAALKKAPHEVEAELRLAAAIHWGAGRIIVPEPVFAEVIAGGHTDAAARAVSDARWIEKRPSPPIPESVVSWEIGEGEASVVATALLEPGTRVVIDDSNGRKCALAHDLDVVGTLGVVVGHQRWKRGSQIMSGRSKKSSASSERKRTTPEVDDADVKSFVDELMRNPIFASAPNGEIAYTAALLAQRHRHGLTKGYSEEFARSVQQTDDFIDAPDVHV